MKRAKEIIKQFAVVVFGLILLAACSDGQMSQRPDANLVEPPKTTLAINSFFAQDASNPDTKSAAKEIEIDEGKSVFLTWDVTGAKTVEIARKVRQRKLDNVTGPKGKVTDDALKADETYILTAEAADGARVQAQATVKVRKREIKITFVAKPQEIRAGEGSELCWQIANADPKAKVTIVDDKKTEVYPGNSLPDAQPSDTPAADSYGTPTPPPAPSTVMVQKLLLAATPTILPADGYGKPKEEPKKEEIKEKCIPVKPAETTAYTLTVKDGDKTASQETKITVTPAPAQIDITFKANGSEAVQLTGPGEVTLSWSVTPADATVEIDHAVTKDDKADGEKKVPVTATTIFTLTAKTKDGQAKSQAVTVTVGRAVGGKVTARLLTPSVFAGEPVKIAVSAENPTAKLNVYSPRGDAAKFTADGATLTITDAVSGNYVVEADGVLSNAVAVEVRQLIAKDTGSWFGAIVRGYNTIVAGGNSSTEATALKTVRVVEGADIYSQALDVGKAISESWGLRASWLVNYAPYRMNNMTAGKNGYIYAAATGGVFYSANGGASWNLIDPMPLYDNAGKYKSIEESHSSCFGITRKGSRNVGGIAAVNPVVNVVEVCDVAVIPTSDGGERLIVATDFGPFFYPNVGARIKDLQDLKDKKVSTLNKEYAMKGGTKENVLFGKVVNKMVVTKPADQVVVVAATNSGIYINTQNGDPKSWQSVGSTSLKEAGSVNALAVTGGVIYAGTDKGLFKSSGLDVASTFTPVTISADTVAVKALAVDAASTLYVGTDKGLKISRSCGASFVDVAAVGSVRNIATATEGGRSAVVLTTDKGLFSSIGAAGTADSCAATQPVTTTPKEPEKPTTTGTRPPPATTGPGTVIPK